MTSPKEKEKKRKACSELINQFVACTNNKLAQIAESLINFIPEFTSLIITQTYSKIINILSTKNTAKVVIDKVFEMLIFMFQNSKGNVQEDPYRTIFSNKLFFNSIFMYTGLDDKGEFNHKIINFIYNCLLLKAPEYFVNFFLESINPIRLLMNSLANQAGDDMEASQLFNSIFASNPKIRDSLISEVIPLVKKFPPHLVVDLMIASEVIKNTMTIDDFKEWLLKQNKFSLSDVNQIFVLYPPLWQSLLPIQMILKTDPPRRIAFIKWIHDMPPIQNIVIPSEFIHEAFNQISCPPYQFESIEDIITSPKESKYDSYDLFVFSRLFVLSYSNPEHAFKGSINFIFECIHSKSEFISTAAIQVLASWIVKFNFLVPSTIVYGICEEICTAKNKSIKCLYQILLHLISKGCKVAEMVIRNDPELRFDAKNAFLVKRSTWEFKNFDELIDLVPSYDDFDEKGMLRVLDCIIDYFGIGEGKEEEIIEEEEEEVK